MLLPIIYNKTYLVLKTLEGSSSIDFLDLFYFMKLTYIYVKKLPNGLFYLGKTQQDPYIYKGSGLIWKLAIKKYKYKNEDIKTWVLHETIDKNDLKMMGKYYSKLFNIVNSDNWANLREEEGDGGSTGIGDNNPMRKYPELAKKIGDKKRGIKRLDMIGSNHHMKRPEVIQKFKGSNNYGARKVNQYDLEGNFIKQYECMQYASIECKINRSNIGSCCRGVRDKAGGFKWSYSN